jgi:multidrug efflux system membrane fusion protein
MFDNDDGMLFPNQFVNARLLVDTRKGAIVVPTATIQQGPNGTFVYVVKADETVELRLVKIGPSEANETLIESGLAADETVVLDGVDKLQNKSRVSFRDKDGESRDNDKPRPQKQKADDPGKSADEGGRKSSS